jgi:hypothetical protein
MIQRRISKALQKLPGVNILEKCVNEVSLMIVQLIIFILKKWQLVILFKLQFCLSTTLSGPVSQIFLFIIPRSQQFGT